jgi:hypothetical protein
MQSEQVVLLTFVSNRQDIRGSLCTFNRDLQQYHQLARSLLRTTTYWVYDPSTKTFGPSKFIGFKSMNFAKYGRARQGHWSGNRFNGYNTRKAVEGILGPYSRDPRLSAQLINWGQALLGPDVFDDINTDKWVFISL